MIVLLLATAAIAVQSPSVQTRLVEKVVERYANEMEGKISFSSVNFQMPGTIALKDVLILDSNPYTEDINNTGAPSHDTVLIAREIKGTVATRQLIKGKGVHLNRLEVRDAETFLALEPFFRGATNYLRVFGGNENDSTKATPPISVSKIYGDNIRFRMSDFQKERKPCAPTAIDYADLDARVSSLEAHDLKINDGVFGINIDKADITERCGANVSASARVKAGPGQTVIRDIHLKDGPTDFRAPFYSMTTYEPHAYKYYCRKVRMKLKVAKGSVISSKTISMFSLGCLDQMDFLLKVDEASAEGYVSDLDIKRIQFTDLYGGVNADLALRLTGITVTDDYMLDATVNKIKFTTAQAETFASHLTGNNVKIKQFAKEQNIEFSGNAKGSLNDFKAKGTLGANSGSAKADLHISNLTDKNKGTECSGTVNTHKLALGSIINQDFLGKVTANTGFKATLDKGSVAVRVDSLLVDHLGLLGYEYTGIAAAGTYSNNAFDGKIICADPNLNFIFQGIFNLSPKTNNALYKFSANVGYADLEALKLDTRGGTSKVSAMLNANLMKIPRGDLLGDFNIYDLTLENDNGVKYIGDIYAGSHTSGGISRAQIQSNFLDAGYVGNRSILDFFEDLQTVTTRRELPALYSVKDKDHGDPDADYDISIDFHDSRDLLSFIKPGVYIADSTRMDLRMKDGRLSGKVQSPRLAYLTNYLKGLDISVDNLGGSANATLLMDELKMGQIGFTNSAFTAFAQNNEFFLSFHYDNIVGLGNMGELYLGGRVERDATDTLIIHAKPMSSYVRFEDSQWDLAESDVIVRANEAKFRNFLIYNGDQFIRINGGISPSRADTLTVGIEKVDLDIINHFSGKDYGLAGKTSGRAVISSPIRGKAMGLINLTCDSLAVAGESAGSLRMALVWDQTIDRVSGFIRDVYEGMDALNVRGSYGFSDKSLNVNAVAAGLKLGLLSPLLPDAVTGLGGSLNGSFNLRGTPDSLSVASNGARIEGGRLKVAYTGVDYKLGGPFHIDNEGIHFDNFSITDP
ncbi:MAG: hypothetical protein IKZ60_06755, partial [Bacteroidales bacterium]|nr:hypothetical protein [Bacteroidales bacterium]